MSTVAENLARIKTAKRDIKAAIENKGVSVGDGTIDTYANKIGEISQTITGKWVVPNGFAIALKHNNTTMPIEGNLDVTSWDFSQLTDMQKFFSDGGKNLIADDIDVSNVTNMNSLFQNVSYTTTVSMKNWDVRNVTDMGLLVQGCPKLVKINLTGWLTSSKLKNIRNIFSNCNELTQIKGIENWDVSGVNNMYYAFSDLGEITDINISGWDFSSLDYNNHYGILSNCPKLIHLNFGYNMKYQLTLIDSTNLSVDSLLSVINGLYDFVGNNETPKSSQGKLYLGSTNLAKLTDEQKAIATNKGWTLS